MRTSLIAVSLTAAALAGTGACAATTRGEPNPAPAAHGRGGDPGATTTGAAPESPLASVDPCGLLGDADLARLAVTGDGQARTQGRARYCEWRVRKGGVRESYTISVSVWEDLGVDQASSDRAVRPVRVGSRDAVEGIAIDGGACFVAMAVTGTSRVDATVVGDDGERLCPVALDLAELVEPELP